MSLYQGITLKALLEDPTLLNPPQQKALSEKDNKDDNELDNIFSGTSAFLGPNIWDKDDRLPYSDLQLEYMDIDEFLCENGIADSQEQPVHVPSTKEEVHIASVNPQVPAPNVKSPESPADTTACTVSPIEDISPPPQPVEKSVSEPGNHDTKKNETVKMKTPKQPISCSVHFEMNPTDVALATIPGQEEFDPTKCHFTEDDLRPQPMIKKSKKIYVAEDMKDSKYWTRRQKNNVAAKRSRDARRIKENQIAMRAAYLETQNTQLTTDLQEAKKEIEWLKSKLAKYEGSS